MAPIPGFDTTGFPVTFAAEVKNFDPLNFVDKKEARKMGRFIHFAFAATQEAIAQSGLQITPENEDRVGVFIGSGGSRPRRSIWMASAVRHFREPSAGRAWAWW